MSKEQRLIPRTLAPVLEEHLATLEQMAFVTGPRQAGKTTLCEQLVGTTARLNWDVAEERAVILAGPKAIAEHADATALRDTPPVLLLDEIHKHARWKALLKGLHDRYRDRLRIVVTGSARLDVHRRVGDSLLGRYFLYRLHPLTVGELLDATPSEALIRPPQRLSDRAWDRLVAHGGHPEPYRRADMRFTRRWQRMRHAQLLREDVRETTRIQELGTLEMLAERLLRGSGAQLNQSALARDLRVSVDTIRRWIETLSGIHLGFVVRPWHRNVARALRKEPKWYAGDWSVVPDRGARAETLVACHLRRAVDHWTDQGRGTFELRYIRDKERREVDFLVVADDKPWFLVEVKRSAQRIAPSLERFQSLVGAEHAFQATFDAEPVDADCFGETAPIRVPVRTLLSQLP